MEGRCSWSAGAVAHAENSGVAFAVTVDIQGTFMLSGDAMKPRGSRKLEEESEKQRGPRRAALESMKVAGKRTAASEDGKVAPSLSQVA